jgi:hypothetical protein
MQSYKRIPLALLIVSAVMVGTVIATFNAPAQDNSARGKQQRLDRAEFETQFPVTDINKPEPSDREKRARRQARGKKHDNAGIHITEGSDTITVNTEWDIGLPALPVAKSDLILIGEVTDVEAYLSNEKTAVYSEFIIRVDEVLKNTSNLAPTQGSSLIADRQGGRVRFPSGHTTLLFVQGQGMPRVGRRYALFLTHTGQEQSANILTGYELRGGRVFPIDSPVGKQYKEAEETIFLNNLRTAVADAQ